MTRLKIQLYTEYSISFLWIPKPYPLRTFHKGDQTNTQFKTWVFGLFESIQSLNQSKSKCYKNSDDNNLSNSTTQWKWIVT